jgi:hypothetical protein
MILSNRSFNQNKITNYTAKIISIILVLIFTFQIASTAIIINDNNFFKINEKLEDQISKGNEENLLSQEVTFSNYDLEDHLENLKPNTVNSLKNEGNSKDQIRWNQPLFSQVPTYNESGLNSQIQANESFIIDNAIADINIQNSFSDESTFQTFSTVNFPGSGYSNKSQSFTVDNLTASDSYNLIEDDDGNKQFEVGEFTRAFATNFTVYEDVVNITTVRLFHGLTFNDGLVQAEAYIANITSGNPDFTPNGGEIINLGNGNNNAWSLHSFNNPVTLTKGTYAIVLNQTNDEINSTTDQKRWYYVDDAVNGNNSQMWAWVNFLTMWTVPVGPAGDLLFEYEYIVLNDTTSLVPKEYLNSPKEVELTYNGTSLTAFTGNNLLLDGTIAEFVSNTSVNFDLFYSINYASNNNPISLITSFSVSNGTNSFWNNSFTHTGAPSGLFNVNQRNYTIYNLPSDWNQTAIYQNTSTFPGSFTYTNGSDELIIHLNQDINASSWLLQFTSPNYIDSLLQIYLR